MNLQIRMAAHPVGFPKSSDFEIGESSIPDIGEGEMLLKTLYLSVDPYMRGRMNTRKSYAAGVQIGEIMIGRTVSEVIASNDSDFAVGDIVWSSTGWQAYGVAQAKGVRKIDQALAPVSTALGILGMPGMTAYFGLLSVGQPKEGETVVVSAAAGAVGSLVGQIAKVKGCRAVGIAGSDEKVNYIVDELGFDGAFNYKTATDYKAELQRLCPDGVDVYFENVGGTITDAVFTRLNMYGRISVCGQISQYNLTEPEMGPRIMGGFISKRLRMQGFLVGDFSDRHEEGLVEMAGWLKEGRLKYREDIVEGLVNAPEAFIGMLQGDNIGKRLVKVG
jgi:hypothetical protein